VAVLLGSEAVNEYKLPVLRHFYPGVDRRLFDKDPRAPSIIIFGNNNLFDTLSNENSLRKIQTSNSQTLVLALKGTDEMSLDELQLLHQIIYQINSGVAVIELGKSAFN
jgi:hypothetical protein